MNSNQNNQQATYELEINKFSDLTFDEFKNKYLQKEDLFNWNAKSQKEIPEKIDSKDKKNTILEKPVPSGYFDIVEITQTFLRGIFKLFTCFFDKDDGIVQVNQTEKTVNKNFIDGIPIFVDWKKKGILLEVKN